MNQTERLLHIVNLLRNRHTVFTAQQLACELGVSLRTIYRDIQKLELSGIPIEGEAGVGYRLHRSVNLPPLMFDAEEVEALMLGVQMVRAWSDKQLSASANSALNKIIGALPSDLKHIGESLPFQVPTFAEFKEDTNPSPQIRAAIKNKQAIELKYSDNHNAITSRKVYPLGLFFWGNVWTLAAWCELRKSYRAFRLDRIQTLTLTQDSFNVTTNCCLDDYIHHCKKA